MDEALLILGDSVDHLVTTDVVAQRTLGPYQGNP